MSEILSEEERARIIKAAVNRRVTVSAVKEKGTDGITVNIEGDPISIIATSISLLKNVGRILKDTDTDLYSMWAVRLISALADTANDDDEE